MQSSGKSQIKNSLLILTSGFPRSRTDSIARFIYDYAINLEKKGYHITILAPYCEGVPPYEEWESLKIYRFPYFFPKKLSRLAYGNGILYNIKNNFLAMLQIPFFFFFEAVYCYKIARKERVSIIHAQWLIPQGLVSIIIRFLLPVKVIVTVHGTDIRSLPKRFVDQLLKKTDAVVSPHPELTGILSSLGFTQIYEIPNITDEDFFNPEILPENFKKEERITSTHIVTFIARLNDFKDPITFIKSIPYVIEKERDVTFLLVGDGPLITEILQLIKQHSLQQFTRVLGARKDVNIILRNSTLFTALSPYENIWSLVIVEAMKMGIPCIITNSGNTQKYLKDTENCVLIPTRDEKALAMAIIDLLHDQKKRNTLSQNGLLFMESHFSTEVILEKYNHLILSISQETS